MPELLEKELLTWCRNFRCKDTTMEVPNIPIYKVMHHDVQSTHPTRMMEVQLLPKFYKKLKLHENKLVKLAGKECWLLATSIEPGYILANQNPWDRAGKGAHDASAKNAETVGTVTVFSPRIYIDTSIVNHLVKTNRLEWQEATQALWREIIDEEYPVGVSQTFFEELDRCYQPKRGEMYKRMEEIKYAIHENTQEVKNLAEKHLSKTNLPKEKCLEDVLHIANAVVNKCNVLLSWNFSHMVNENFIPKFNEANIEMGYNNIDILTPETFLKGIAT